MSVPDPIPDLLSVAQVAERWRTKFDTPADEKYVLGCYGRLSFCISNFEPLASGYVTYSRDDVIARVKAESSFKEAFEFIRDLTKFEIDLLRVRREDLLTFEATQCDPSNMPDPFSEKLAERIELVIQTKISNGRVKVIDMLDEMSRVLNSLPSAAMRIYELSKGGKLDDRHGWVDSLTQDDIAMINKIWAEAALPRFTFGLPSDDWDNYQIAFEQAANRPTWNLQVCCFLPNRRQQAIECLFKNLSCSDYLVAYSDSGELAKQIELTSNIDVRDASRWLESWGFRLRQDGASEHNQAIKSGRPTQAIPVDTAKPDEQVGDVRSADSKKNKPKKTNEELAELLRELDRCNGNAAALARRYNISPQAMRRHISRAKEKFSKNKFPSPFPQAVGRKINGRDFGDD